MQLNLDFSKAIVAARRVMLRICLPTHLFWFSTTSYLSNYQQKLKGYTFHPKSHNLQTSVLSPLGPLGCTILQSCYMPVLGIKLMLKYIKLLFIEQIGY